MERPWRTIQRRPSRSVRIGDVAVGGGAPISVQTMTNTPTEDIEATAAQIRAAAAAGADIVRLSCPTKESTQALRQLVKESPVPLIADIHFHYRRAIEAAEAGAAALRINPGNIGTPERIKMVVQAAKDHNCAIRIGVNAGSLEKRFLEKYKEPTPEALVESALYHLKFLEDLGFFNVKLSVKASDVFLSVAAYRLLAKACDYPLHLGITEAGSFLNGTVQSALGIGTLLWEGIGDTIRVSLAADPVEEVRVGFSLLKALDLRHRGVRIIACPSCARMGFDVITLVNTLEDRLQNLATPLNISILGCVVNGLGEALHTDIGIAGAPAGKHILFLDGRRVGTVTTEDLLETVLHYAHLKAPPKEEASHAR